MPYTVQRLRPWLATGVAVILVVVGVVQMQMGYIALGAGALGLKGFGDAAAET